VKLATSSASEAVKVEVEVVWPIRQEDEKRQGSFEARAQFKMNESANSPARRNGQARFMTYGYRSSKALSPNLILLAPTSRYRRERLKCRRWKEDCYQGVFPKGAKGRCFRVMNCGQVQSSLLGLK